MAIRSLYICLALLVAGLSIFLSSRSPSTPSTLPRSTLPGRNNSVLFVADAHPGLSNAHIAASHALQVHFPHLEIHFASFPKLSTPLSLSSSFAISQNPLAKPVNFHPLVGNTYAEALLAAGIAVKDVILPPGIKGIARLCRDMQMYLMPWSAPEHVEIYEDVLRVMGEINPTIVVADTLFGPGLDAIRAQGRNYVILSPNALKDNLASMQPWGRMLWKYPACVFLFLSLSPSFSCHQCSIPQFSLCLSD